VPMTENRLPFVITLASALLGTMLVVLILYVGREILTPIALSAFLALLIQPIVRFLMKHRVPHVLAIAIALTVLILAIAGIITLCSVQIAQFTEEWPRLESKIDTYVAQLQGYVEERLHIEQGQQKQMLKEGAGSLAQSGAAGIGAAVLAVSSITIQLFLVPIYIFLFLYYHDLWVEFFFRLASRKEHGKVVVMPFIVGGKVNVNSLAALVALLVGAAIWGVIGMILSLPIVTILKVIFDHVDGLKPWGLVLGDTIPKKSS
jgi:predicted PurR-regulated permease PerM